MDAPSDISASQGAIRSLPMKLESLLSGVPKHGLRDEEKKKLRILQSDLQGLIDSYLLEPSEVESPSSTAHSWMKGVRDLSYDIDDFIYELAHFVVVGARIGVVQKPRRFKICRFPEKLRRRQWITDEISAFRTRVKEAIRRHSEYLGSNCKWRPSSSGQPPPSPSGESAIHLVGVDSSIQQICGLLANDGQPEHRVVSIVGTGGVGKTTLAREVYRKLGGQFQCLAFVRTSPKQDMKGLLTSVFSQVQRRRHLPGPGPDDALDVHKLVLNIRAHLQDKTYLIVIEDLRALSTWDLVNRALPKGICCSRILMTTEVDVIAQTCCADNSKCIPAEKEDKPKYMPSEENYILMYMPSKKESSSMYIIKKEPLRENESRELFSNRAFGNQAECPQALKEVSDEIIRRIGGLPLGINILASLLAHHPASSIEQWNYIKNSLSSDLTTHANLENINQVLNIGYDNLPHYLKACMLYLCLYEEDCIIWKDDLVKQWIAEGFIPAVKGQDREEVARSYFGELVSRGIIQPVDTNCSDEILSCRVHHIVLHFIRDKCRDENFCIALDHSQTIVRLADKVRRLALHLGNVEHAKPPGTESMRLSKVRSIAFSGFHKCMPSILKYRFLQVLNLKLSVDPHEMMSHNLTGFDDLSGNLTGSNDLSGNLTGSDDLSGNITEPDEWKDNLSEPDGLSYNLTGISELFRLRYFHLDARHMSVSLPTQMQQLKDLVAWEIDAEVTAVPSDIVDLPGLLYLRIPSEAHLPTGIGRMTSLRTLGVFDLSKNLTEDVMSLGELTSLHDLRLTCSTQQPDNLEKNLECLGSVIRKLSNLKCVTLVPAVSSHVNTQHDAGASSVGTSWCGFSIVALPPALQKLELSRRCCLFSSLPVWTKELTKLGILKIAVRKVSQEDAVILKGLPSLTALSLFIWTTPAIRIIFDNEGFSVLKYFKFVCAAPCMEFMDEAMPNVRKLKLGFNANRMERYSLDAAGFKRLTGLTEISIKIGGTGADEGDRESAQSVLTDAIVMHPSTPIINVQWVDWDYCGDDEKDTEPRKEIWDQTSEETKVTAVESSDDHWIQKKNLEEDAKKQADTRTYVAPESTFDLQNTDLKLSLIDKHTHGVAEKHKVEISGSSPVEKGASTLDNVDEWKWKLHMLLRNDNEQEIMSRERKDRRDFEQLAQLADRMGLHSRQYSRIIVFSKVPSPNYRSDFDDKRPQREVSIPSGLQREVDALLADYLARKRTDSRNFPNAAFSRSSSTDSFMTDEGFYEQQDNQTSTNVVMERIQRKKSIQESIDGQSMMEFRRSLPANKERQSLLEAISQNQVVVVSGETGCGKTTQLPQYILESEIEAARGATCSIICTQPRRISAISVSERVAAERGEKIGESVGYKVRLEGMRGRDTRLLFCTTGVLLRRLLVDRSLKGVTHVIVDEIHERGMNEDFLLIVLKDLLPRRPELRLVLMSATLNAEMFSSYFGGAPMIHIPVFTYPVRSRFLEDILEITGHRLTSYNQIDDYGQEKSWKMQKQALRKRKSQIASVVEDAVKAADLRDYSPQTCDSLSCWNPDSIGFNLIENVLCHICQKERDGAVLVFMTGWDDINTLKEQLQANPLLGDPSKVLLLACHGSMASAEQKLIFDKPEPGVRKIVLATNLAETSITINDVVFVVDCGKAKETSYDALNNTPCLLPTWISKASARQRRGRAGRVQSGECFHLYPQCVYNAFADYQLPELLRTPLQSLCLQIKSLRLGSISEFLSRALQSPKSLLVQNAIEYLKVIGAFDQNEELTVLGKHLSMLPVEPKLGKMLIFGAIFNCLDPILTIVSGLSVRDPFMTPFDKKDLAESAKLQFSCRDYSDHLAIVRAYDGWREAERDRNGYDYCWRNFLSAQTLKALDSLRRQFLFLLKDTGLIDENMTTCNKWSRDENLVRAVICAGLYPGVSSVVNKGKSISLKTMEDGQVMLYSSSVNGKEAKIPFPWLVFNEKVKVNSVFLRDSTAISDSILLLFGGNIKQGGLDGHLKMLGGYLEFFMSRDLASTYLNLKSELEDFIHSKLQNPRMDIQTSEELLLAVRLLVTEDPCSGRFVYGRQEPRSKKAKTMLSPASISMDHGGGHGGDNPKNQLQTLLTRAGNDDPTYKTKQIKNSLFRSTVEFNGMEFVGQPCANKKLAEKDAAGEAINWLTGRGAPP